MPILPDPTDLATERPTNAADVLQQMADTFRERNKVYGDNYKRVGEVMVALFPNGVTLDTPDAFNTWHLFELMIVKLTRFVVSDLKHLDSIHDLAVYAAMVEAEVNRLHG